MVSGNICQGLAMGGRTVTRPKPSTRDTQIGPNPTLVSPAAKSPHVAVTSISAKEGSQLYAAVIAIKSMCGIFSTLCQKG
jgi:hypothetical protein